MIFVGLERSPIDLFLQLKKRNKLVFTFIVGISIVMFWKGAWGLLDFLFDEIIFQGHIVWSNLIVLLFGFWVLFAAGMALEKLA